MIRNLQTTAVSEFHFFDKSIKSFLELISLGKEKNFFRTRSHEIERRSKKSNKMFKCIKSNKVFTSCEKFSFHFCTRRKKKERNYFLANLNVSFLLLLLALCKPEMANWRPACPFLGQLSPPLRRSLRFSLGLAKLKENVEKLLVRFPLRRWKLILIMVAEKFAASISYKVNHVFSRLLSFEGRNEDQLERKWKSRKWKRDRLNGQRLVEEYPNDVEKSRAKRGLKLVNKITDSIVSGRRGSDVSQESVLHIHSNWISRARNVEHSL